MGTMTIRYAHLAEPSPLMVGTIVKAGDEIGKIGDTGQSTGAHLHIDVCRGCRKEKWFTTDYEQDSREGDGNFFAFDLFHQLGLFVDRQLLNNEKYTSKMQITSYVLDPLYYQHIRKRHYGIDIVVSNGETEGHPVYWNRSMDGTVISKHDMPRSYGYCVHIAWDVE